MSSWHLSRVRLRQDVPAAALAPVLLPEDEDARVDHAHRLLWTLFADGPDRRRDFLWREVGERGLAPGRSAFFVLSPRRPSDHHDLFKVETKPFEPRFAAGDRLAFSLRANPVVTRKNPKSGRPQRHDVVMDHLRAVPSGERGQRRIAAMTEAGAVWLRAQGKRYGFRLVSDRELRVDGYDQLRLRRGRGRGSPVTLSRLDLDGVIEVVESESFLAALLRGFGKGKAFGCGLMLIRRVP